MKSALVILPACLLVLSHLTIAQMSSTEIPFSDCEQVQNLSPECAMAFAQVITGPDVNSVVSFCDGDCFGPVLSAYQSCGSAATDTVQQLQEGEKSYL